MAKQSELPDPDMCAFHNSPISCMGGLQGLACAVTAQQRLFTWHPSVQPPLVSCNTATLNKPAKQTAKECDLLDMEIPPAAGSSPSAGLPPAAAGTLARVAHGCPRLVPSARIVTAGLDDLMWGRLPHSCLLLDRSLPAQQSTTCRTSSGCCNQGSSTVLGTKAAAWHTMPGGIAAVHNKTACRMCTHSGTWCVKAA
jgi:hypothetical protein